MPQPRFLPSFWVANGMELFERLAFYGQQVVLMIFLRDHLKFSVVEAGSLSSIFSGLIYFLPIFAGAMADIIGFKRAFTIAFSGLAVGYFVIGSMGMQAFQPLYGPHASFSLLVLVLALTAVAGSFIKPSVLGTVAVTTTPESKSMGYAVYYWIVNMGGAVGPVLANLVRNSVGIQFVYVTSALSCLAMLVVNVLFYREVQGDAPAERESLQSKVANLFLVLKNARFMLFLLIFSLFWAMYWQIWVVVPCYLVDFVSSKADYDLISSAGAWSIIILQLGVNYVTRGLRPRAAVVLGFAISACCWLMIAMSPTVPVFVAAIVVLAIGEMTQAPRYYEYISELAPPGQQGLFQGYAFLPIAIGSFAGGPAGTWLYQRLAKEGGNPTAVWLTIFGVGVLATVLMLIYNVVVTRLEQRTAA